MLAAAWTLGAPTAALAEQAKAAVQPSPAWPFRAATTKPATTAPGGIGLVLEARADGVYAQSLVPGGPAAKAGAAAGDHIARVDQWPVPAGIKVPEVAEHIRGTPGTTVELGVKRGGRDVVLTVTRVALHRLFPETSKDIMVVRPGFSLLASGAAHTVGVHFPHAGKAGEPLHYDWAVAPATEAAGGAGSQHGQGLILVGSDDTANLPIADWRLALKVQPDGAVYVFSSNLPVHEPAGDWRTVAPPWPTLVKPRSNPAARVVRWEGPERLKVQLSAEGKPLARVRATLKLADAAGVALDTRTALTDGQGIAAFQVPAGAYKVQALAASASGPGSDAHVTHDLQASDATAKAGDASPLVVALTPKPAPPPQQLTWGSDPRVGQGLPALEVQRWFGLDKPPATLAGKVLLVDVWATWCGPCRFTAPLVNELHARLGAKGLQVVALSVDKDEAAIEAFAKEQLPGGVPIAWAGPDAMETLETESVPTFFVVDERGRIRGVHKGMGWDVASVQAFLESLLAERGKK